MKLKKTLCFETDDGKTFPDEIEATTHQSMLTIRGFLQKQFGMGTTITASGVAELLSRQSEEFSKLLSGINAAKKRVAKKAGK